MRDYNIESDLKQEKFEVIKLVQGDKGNKLTINVLEDGKPVSLTGCSITAKYKRADGQVINGSVTNISNNSFDAVIDSDITKVSGVLKMLFSIEKDDVKVSTFLLLADVREGLLENTGSSGGGEVTVDLKDYQKKTDNGLETKNKYIVGAINEVNSQCKDIANQQPTDLSLDSATNLLQLVNSKGSKLGNGITLPISSGGGISQYLHIKYSSTGAPQLAGQMSDTPNAYIGLCVDTNADAPTNPRSYTWYQWKGDNGAKGDTGATPNLQIGTVTTLDSGSNATASITGTTENPLLNLGIPKGADGESGTGTGGSSEIWKKVIETTFGEDCYAFTVTKDKDDNGLQIKEGFIFITASQPKDTSSNLSFGIGFKDWESSFNGKATIYSLSLYKNYEFYRVGFYFKVINNFVFTQYLGNNRIGVSAPIYNNFNSSSISNANMTSNFRALLNNLDYIDKITVGLDMSTTGLFSKDSIMEVWAKC